jgi:hypothetical protein
VAHDITLGEIGETLEFIVERMATKNDIAELRRELKGDIAEIRETMATKEDFKALRAEVADIRRDLKELARTVHNIAGLPKEIDHALDRIRRIERHLGIESDIAA